MLTTGCFSCSTDFFRKQPRILKMRHHHHHQFLTPAIWQRLVRMNDLHCPRSFVKFIAPFSVSSSDAIGLHLYCLSNVVWVCLCFFFLRILHVVHCVEFGQLSFFLHVQTIGVFALSMINTED